jgi:SAM-dependent methyltransferase
MSHPITSVPANDQAPETRRVWDEVGKIDPMNYILPGPGGTGARWNPDEFFATGERSVELVLGRLEHLKIPVTFGTALDFGCGVGRLTQALGARFALTYGVDVAPSMVNAAERMNRRGPACRYLVNPTEDLRAFQDATVDFLLSDIVLQHIRPRLALGYVSEFLRLLRPGGVAVFYLPGRRLHRGPASPFIAASNKIRYGTASTMNYGVEREVTSRVIEQGGGRIIEVRVGDWLDRGQNLPSERPDLRTRLWVAMTYQLSDQWERSTYLVQKSGTSHGPP